MNSTHKHPRSLWSWTLAALVTVCMAAAPLACGEPPAAAPKGGKDPVADGGKGGKDGGSASTAGDKSGTDTAGVAEGGTAGGDEDAPLDIKIDDKVKLAAKVAAAIASEPERADEILASNELDRDKLDVIMYEIASDADLTQQYKIARAGVTTG